MFDRICKLVGLATIGIATKQFLCYSLQRRDNINSIIIKLERGENWKLTPEERETIEKIKNERSFYKEFKHNF